MNFLGLFCLIVIAGLLISIIFDRTYKDTLLERIGLSAVSLWCGLTFVEDFNKQISSQQLILYSGLAMLAFSKKIKQNSPLPPATRWFNKVKQCWSNCKH